MRATAAAAGGHTGAQLSVLGEAAVGAKVSIWWPLDEAWYPGMVSGLPGPEGGRRVFAVGGCHSDKGAVFWARCGAQQSSSQQVRARGGVVP